MYDVHIIGQSVALWAVALIRSYCFLKASTHSRTKFDRLNFPSTIMKVFERLRELQKEKSQQKKNNENSNKWASFFSRSKVGGMCVCVRAWSMCCEKYHCFKSAVSNMFISVNNRRAAASMSEGEGERTFVLILSFFLITYLPHPFADFLLFIKFIFFYHKVESRNWLFLPLGFFSYFQSLDAYACEN